MKKMIVSLLLMTGFCLLQAQSSKVHYVKTDGAGNGSSWSEASNNLQQVINASNAGDSIWVAGGTYLPMIIAGDGRTDRDKAYVLKKDIKIFGSFAGAELNIESRTPSVMAANPSILSGDLGVTGNSSDNAYHVVIGAGDVGAAELNGFIITGGYADGGPFANLVNSILIGNDIGAGLLNEQSSPILANLTINGNTSVFNGAGIHNNFNSSPILTNITISNNNITGNGNGGGMYNANSSSPILTNVTISGNSAAGGGGMENYSNCNPVLTNVIISGNKGIYYGGGGMRNSQSSPILTSVTISGNYASAGAAIRNDNNSSTVLHNSIVYGNSSGILNDNSVPTIAYSLIQGSAATTNGNLDGTAALPIFINTPDVTTAPFTGGDYHLLETSPTIDKGNDGYFDAGTSPNLSAIVTDLAGNPRFVGAAIDMGAYETQGAALPVSLKGFSARTEGSQVLLEWSTAMQINNKEFTIFRSGDGKTFSHLVTIASAENSSLQQDYAYYDMQPFQGMNYYRLQQVSLDGHITDYGVKSVNLSRTGNQVRVYPNPASDHLYIQVSKAGEIRIFNVSGNLVKTQIVHEGLNRMEVSHLNAGIYFIKVGGVKLKFVKK